MLDSANMLDERVAPDKLRYSAVLMPPLKAG
jgi:hypothetical protein